MLIRNADTMSGNRALGLGGLAWSQLVARDYEAARETAEEAVRISMAPIDRIIGTVMVAAALVLMGRTAEGSGALRDYVSDAIRSGLAIGLPTSEQLVGVGMVLEGDFGGGIRAIAESERLHTSRGSPFARPFRDEMLGETYLQMAIGGEKPPLAVMLRNFWFLARTLPVAARRARHHLEAALEWGRAHDSPATVAVSLTNLGLLHQAKKRTVHAKACFDEARDVAQANEMQEIVKKIDAAAATLR